MSLPTPPLINGDLIVETFQAEIVQQTGDHTACTAFILHRLPRLLHEMSEELGDTDRLDGADVVNACARIHDTLLTHLEQENLLPQIPAMRALARALNAGAAAAMHSLAGVDGRENGRSSARANDVHPTGTGGTSRAETEQLELLRNVSHELRTPLQAILGWVSLLRGGQLPRESQPRALEAIERNAKLQSELITKLLHR